MTAQTTLASTPELTPLADFLTGVLKRLRPLPPLELDLAEAYGHVLAEDVRGLTGMPAFDRASIDGYAARFEDLLGASLDRPVALTVVGDLVAASWRPVRLEARTCYAVAAGAPLPSAADVVVPPALTDQGMAAVEIFQRPRKGHGVRRAGDEIPSGAVLAPLGTFVSPGLVALLASTGLSRLAVQPSPRVSIIATGDELVDAGRPSQPGQVVDANSYALASACTEAGAAGHRVGICDDDPSKVRATVEEQVGRSDLIITTGGTATGPGDMIRRVFGRSVAFTEVTLTPCGTLGYGVFMDVPLICLPGDPGAALIGFEVLARPVIRKLAGAERVFRQSVRAHLLETLSSPLGLREFRPAHVYERRGGGYTAQPLPGGPYTLSGLALANGLIVLGEKVGNASAGSTVDVLMLDRRR